MWQPARPAYFACDLVPSSPDGPSNVLLGRLLRSALMGRGGRMGERVSMERHGWI